MARSYRRSRTLGGGIRAPGPCPVRMRRVTDTEPGHDGRPTPSTGAPTGSGSRAVRAWTGSSARSPSRCRRSSATCDLPDRPAAGRDDDRQRRRLGHLDLVHGRTLDGLNHLQLRTEAVDSSKIEHVEASLADYGRALLGIGANSSAVSMASATPAMHADDQRRRHDPEDQLRGDPPRTRGPVRDATPTRRTEPAGSASCRTGSAAATTRPVDALHVPPPPETVPDYIDDLFAFANRDDLPPLVQAAIVHAQFESIHPFIDGNGRIGRALIHAVLRRRRAARHLAVPIASALVAHRDRYFGAAQRLPVRVRGADDRDARGVDQHRHRRVVEYGGDLQDLRKEWHDAVGGTRPGTALHRLLDLLTEEPIVNVALVMERLDAPSRPPSRRSTPWTMPGPDQGGALATRAGVVRAAGAGRGRRP